MASRNAHLRRVLPWLRRRPTTPTPTSISDPTLTPSQLLSLYTSPLLRNPRFRHPLQTYQTLIPALARRRRLRAVLLLLSRMPRDVLTPPPSLLLPLLLSHPQTSIQIAFAVPPVHDKVFSKLLHLLLSSDRLDLAGDLFLKPEFLSKLGFHVRVRHYVGVVRGLCWEGDWRRGIEVLEVVAERCGSVPNVFCYGSLVSGVCRRGMVDGGFELVAQMRRRGREPDLVVWNAVLDGCVRSGEMERVEEVFKHMEDCGVVGDVWTYNLLVRGFCEHRSAEDGVRGLVDVMIRKGVVPDVVTFTTLVGWLCKEKKVGECWVLLGKMVRMVIQPDSVCSRILLGELCDDKHMGWRMKVPMETLLQQMKTS